MATALSNTTQLPVKTKPQATATHSLTPAHPPTQRLQQAKTLGLDTGSNLNKPVTRITKAPKVY